MIDPTHRRWCEQLEQIWHEQIPITRAMGIRVIAASDTALTVTADVTANVNPHSTVFAGSLYSVCVLTGWGAAWLALKRSESSGQIVAKSARIRYFLPVDSAFECGCELADSQCSAALAELTRDGRCELNLDARIRIGAKVAVAFTGLYSIRASRGRPEPA